MNFWTIPTANMTYTRSQNYTNMAVDKHGIITFKVVLVVLLLLLLSFDVLVPQVPDKWQVHIPFFFWTSGLSKLYLNVNLITWIEVSVMD